MIDEADHQCDVTPGVPQQRRPHAEAWLGRTVADAADAPRIARSAGDEPVTDEDPVYGPRHDARFGPRPGPSIVEQPDPTPDSPQDARDDETDGEANDDAGDGDSPDAG